MAIKFDKELAPMFSAHMRVDSDFVSVPAAV